MHLDTRLPVSEPFVVIIPNLQLVMNSSRSWIFWAIGVSVSRLAFLYGSAGASPVDVFENVFDMFKLTMCCCVIHLAILWALEGEINSAVRVFEQYMFQENLGK